MIKLGINIDHIATLRNARGDFFPSLLAAAAIIEQNGGDFITIHLREDRRHIRDDDLFLLNNNVSTYVNLEMACNKDVLEKALAAKPVKVTLVPEKREEITTEGGLNLAGNFDKIKDYIDELKRNGILISLFIEPDVSLIDKICSLAPDDVEIHTGGYANSKNFKEKNKILSDIKEFSKKVKEMGIKVCAGHGLNFHNVEEICKIDGIEELNIGYSIVARALFVGLAKSTSAMKSLIRNSERKV
ncbi:MAG: Pyridoxine 5'-phosphate synthase [Spirochaetes bacterium ADurb.Bin133]|nr:MAG: Pyridoxine 5'-phosphate synthase [Spirochaetes bacterium ADurb.Bin133]